MKDSNRIGQRGRKFSEPHTAGGTRQTGTVSVLPLSQEIVAARKWYSVNEWQLFKSQIGYAQQCGGDVNAQARIKRTKNQSKGI
jgi:hypothetical protein